MANKLGLNNLILLNNQRVIRFSGLLSENFFKKIAGYDTLRILLSKKTILVEGDSDELVVQKAYMQQHNNKLPIEDGIDVMSVGTSFLRFLELADKLNIPVSVVTDNDGDVGALQKKYKNYLGSKKKENIRICVDWNVDKYDEYDLAKYNGNTLEPKLFKANDENVGLFNTIFGTNHTNKKELLLYMKEHKTECALKVFETEEEIKMPEYILEAIKNE